MCRELNTTPNDPRIQGLYPEQIQALFAIWPNVADNAHIAEINHKTKMLAELKKKPAVEFIPAGLRSFYTEAMIAREGYSREQVGWMLQKQGQEMKEKEIWDLKLELNQFESEEERHKAEVERTKKLAKHQEQIKEVYKLQKKQREAKEKNNAG